MESIEKMKASFLQYVAGYASGKKANRYQKKIMELLGLSYMDNKELKKIFCETGKRYGFIQHTVHVIWKVQNACLPWNYKNPILAISII